jgi:hypothetical protein
VKLARTHDYGLPGCVLQPAGLGRFNGYLFFFRYLIEHRLTLICTRRSHHLAQPALLAARSHVSSSFLDQTHEDFEVKLWLRGPELLL